MKLKLRRRLNIEIDGKKYWKWYLDIPSKVITTNNLKNGDMIEVKI